MSLATSMKDLVENIQVSTSDRHAFVKGMSKDVQGLLAQFNKELKELAQEIKKFLATSEHARKEDFGAMMKDIAERLGEISKSQKDIRKDARELVKEYATDHKKASELWLSLSGHGKKPAHAKKEAAE